MLAFIFRVNPEFELRRKAVANSELWENSGLSEMKIESQRKVVTNNRCGSAKIFACDDF